MSTLKNQINSAVRKVSAESAIKLMLLLTMGITLFHLLIVAQIIPYNIVWGGRLTSYTEMIRFESFSITINVVIMAIAAMAGGYIKQFLPNRILKTLLWGLFFLLVANTIANPFSATLLEAIVFTPMTAVMAFCLYRLILARGETSSAIAA